MTGFWFVAGRGYTDPATKKMVLMANYADALQQLRNIEDTRRKRGYQRVL